MRSGMLLCGGGGGGGGKRLLPALVGLPLEVEDVRRVLLCGKGGGRA